MMKESGNKNSARGHQTRLSFKWKQSLASSFFKNMYEEISTIMIIFISHKRAQRREEIVMT